VGNIKIDSDKIKDIFEQTLSTINLSKHQMFDIAENVRNEYNALKKELSVAREKLLLVMSEVNMFESQVSKGRERLCEVNKNYDTYPEEVVEQIYDKVNNLVIVLAEKREEERNAIQLRNSLEQRVKTYSQVLGDTEKLISQVSVAINFLDGNLSSVIKNINDFNEKSFLGIQIIEALELERERVARDIHDGPAQSFANLSLSIELIKKLLDVDKDKALFELDQMKLTTKENLTEMRKVIYDLKPFDISELGLIDCINHLIESFSEGSGVIFNLKTLSKITFKNDLINMTIFRIIRESLNNIKKYAHAKNVDIIIEQSDQFLNLSIFDDGVGFDPKKVLTNSEHGFGLASIKRQCSYLQATFDITTEPGKGTKIKIRMPLE